MSHQEATQLFKNRHSLAHVLLMAIQKHYPKALPTIGPVTETGFYYDVDFGTDKIAEADLKNFQTSMRKNLKKFTHFYAVSEPARVFMAQTCGVDGKVLGNPLNYQFFHSFARSEETQPSKKTTIPKILLFI